MSAKVNLDALIPREDFEAQEDNKPPQKKATISIEDIKADAFFYSYLRKPDFQRETNAWESKKIFELITSFIEGDLIPAIILWRSPNGNVFVIDGSHRLSALFAWVNDDYGDGKISKTFYDGVIPDEQIQVAEKTRKLVNRKIGSYSDFKLANTHPDKVRPEVIKYARNLGYLAIQLQWVEGDASKAENSYIKINQQHTPIDKTELKLIKSRKKPNSIAARAIISSGQGHKYWSSFSTEIQNKIQEIAAEINTILFEPKLQTPIKTLDVPVAGKLYSAKTLPLIFDFVNIVNNNDINNNKKLQDDQNGEETIKFLKNVRKIAYKINSNHASSLGLHPIVYFYSKDGLYRTVCLLAVVDFVIELERRKKTNDFIKVRAKLENIVLNPNDWIQQIYQKYNDNQKSYKQISNFFQEIITILKTGKTIDEAIDLIRSNSAFKYLNAVNISQNTQLSYEKDFNTNKKSQIYIKDSLNNAPRCKICNGLIHRNSISIDHIKRKRDDGFATVDNGQITHPYCNTGYKN